MVDGMNSTTAACGPSEPAQLRAWGTSGWMMAIFLSGQPVGIFVVWALMNTGRLRIADLDGSSFVGVFSDGFALALSVIAAAPVQLAVLAWAASRRGRDLRSLLALRAVPTLRTAAVGLAALIALTAAGDGIATWTGRPTVSSFQTDLYASAAHTGKLTGLAALWLAMVVCAPVVEELLFRGLGYAGYRRAMGRIGAMALTTAIWAALHIQYDAFGLAEVTIAGALFGWARIASGTIVLPIALHSIMNLYATLQTAAATGWPT
jgi:membrane protease YdiL (CAAX protease family)